MKMIPLVPDVAAGDRRAQLSVVPGFWHKIGAFAQFVIGYLPEDVAQTVSSLVTC